MLLVLKEAHKLIFIFQINNHFIGFKIWLKKEELHRIKSLLCNQENQEILLSLLKMISLIFFNSMQENKLNHIICKDKKLL